MEMRDLQLHPWMANLLDRWATMQRLDKGFRPTANHGLGFRIAIGWIGISLSTLCTCTYDIPQQNASLLGSVDDAASGSHKSGTWSIKVTRHYWTLCDLQAHVLVWDHCWSVGSFYHTAQPFERRFILLRLHNDNNWKMFRDADTPRLSSKTAESQTITT